MSNTCFSNTSCDYYPCHTYKTDQPFNCLFCYCPMYRFEHCLGNPTYVQNAKGQSIKSCLNCVFPHVPQNYDKIMEFLKKKNEVVCVELSEWRQSLQHRLAKMSGFDQMEEEVRQEHEALSQYLYEMYFRDEKVNILLQKFSKQCVEEKQFVFGKTNVSCNILERLNLEQEEIDCGYFYVFHAPNFSKQLEKDYESLSLLEQCYVENWMIAVLDVGRDWIRNYLLRKHSVRHARYVTDSFGPGFYGMSIEELPKLHKLMDADDVGVSLTKDGTLFPMKSCIGMYLVTTKDVSYLMGHDCVNCAGSKLGCHACRG